MLHQTLLMSLPVLLQSSQMPNTQWQCSCLFCRLGVSSSLTKEPKLSSPHVGLRHFYRAAQCLGTSLFPAIRFQARIKRVSTLLSVEWKTLISLWVIVDRGQRHCTSDLFTWVSSRLPQSKQHKGAICKTNMAAGWHWLYSCAAWYHTDTYWWPLMSKFSLVLILILVWKKLYFNVRMQPKVQFISK